MADPPDQSLQDAIAALWRDARPRALERVAALEDAVEALRADALDADTATAATGEAHKLAGALGTFGMPEGTTQARAIERALTAGATAADAPALAERVAVLRAVVEGGADAAGALRPQVAIRAISAAVAAAASSRSCVRA